MQDQYFQKYWVEAEMAKRFGAARGRYLASGGNGQTVLKRTKAPHCRLETACENRVLPGLNPMKPLMSDYEFHRVEWWQKLVLFAVLLQLHQ